MGAKREIDFEKIRMSRNSGPYRITHVIPREKRKKGNLKAGILFIETGNTKDVYLNCALNGQVRDHDNYRGAKIDPEKIYTNQRGLEYRITHELPLNEHGNRMCNAHFIESGTDVPVPLSNALRGKVKDRFAPNKSTNGYLGNSDRNDPYYNMLVDIWWSMLDRCNNDKPDRKGGSYNKYGALGVTVCEEWHNFENFLRDAKELPNFAYKAQFPDEYELDKDYLQQCIPRDQRVYSKDTCVWLHRKDNNLVKNIGRTDDSCAQHRNIIKYGDVDAVTNAFDNRVTRPEPIMPCRLVQPDIPTYCNYEMNPYFNQYTYGMPPYGQIKMCKIVNENPQSSLLDFINNYTENKDN